jgi:hypothetical protein
MAMLKRFKHRHDTMRKTGMSTQAHPSPFAQFERLPFRVYNTNFNSGIKRPMTIPPSLSNNRTINR